MAPGLQLRLTVRAVLPVGDPDGDLSLDLAQLDQLVELEGRIVRELVDLFLVEAVVRMKAIELAVARADFATASRIAHALRGAASQLGARSIAQAAHAFELGAQLASPELPAAVALEAAVSLAAAQLDRWVIQHGLRKNRMG